MSTNTDFTTGLVLILLTAVIALLGIFYFRWCKWMPVMKWFVAWLDVPWWLAWLTWIIFLAVSVVVFPLWFFIYLPLRLFGRVPGPPKESLQEVITPEDRVRPRYIPEHDTPQLESPAMRRARQEREAAALEWQQDVQQRAKAQEGDVRERGSFTVAMALQPGDLKIIRVGIAAFREQHNDMAEANLHGYIADNIVHIQDRRNRVVGTYNIFTQTVTRNHV